MQLATVLDVTQEQYTPSRRSALDIVELQPPHGIAEDYLRSRRVSVNDAVRYGIRWEPGARELYLPIWSPLLGKTSWVRRKIDGKAYYNDGARNISWLFGRENQVRKDYIIIVEGPFDVLSPGLWGQAVSLLGSNMSEQVEMWLHEMQFSEIYLWLDPDSAGFQKAPEIMNRLQKWHPRVIRMHGFAFDQRDPGDYRMNEASILMSACKKLGKWTPGLQEIGCSIC